MQEDAPKLRQGMVLHKALPVRRKDLAAYGIDRYCNNYKPFDIFSPAPYAKPDSETQMPFRRHLL